MPLIFDPGAMQEFKSLPDELRRDAAVAILLLLSDPVPAEAEPYAGIPDAYRLASRNVVVYYRAVGEAVIDVLRIRPNS